MCVLIAVGFYYLYGIYEALRLESNGVGFKGKIKNCVYIKYLAKNVFKL